MKIVVLDGYTLNPGDLNWEKFSEIGELKVYDRTSPQDILERTTDANIVLTNKTVLTAENIAAMNKVEYIGVLATGVNVVDLEYTKKTGITVTNVPGYSGSSSAQMVFALILELTNRVGHHSQTVTDGKWSASKDFCYWDYPLVELEGITLGIVGYGGIGKAVARIGLAFGMNILIYNRSVPPDLPDGITYSDLDNLIHSSDIISLHCPLTPQTKGMINKESLAQMKKTAYLINTSRGPLIVENDLADFLNEGRIAGAAMDVLDVEPPDKNCPLLTAKNCYITPHIAWATIASRERLMSIAVENIKSYLAGNPQNVVPRK
ncbi:MULTISPECIES: D-2-hydroxyacid dehydrogenase [Desulfobacter]|uniref:D-2-hydroxyacid dehydrogenase n=1 Tax=Desulfobacter TaxID=2289 RepID=UPI000E893A15|nr:MULTISPECIES: D-2-hydroxyacid dehydrogenase [unclassified Desulfobacter]MBP8828447.1 D-2-hydroxyacid dehydrogenase [Desulfobacter sp.]HAR33273.1 glycerate dehydrogenase [Desulfobacter sp.]HRF91700.1 D-2-hydroxyacid dehydrogenase [Desulfobacter postgatei]